jgi:hypothetical protein
MDPYCSQPAELHERTGFEGKPVIRQAQQAAFEARRLERELGAPR